LKELDLDGKMILKCIARKYDRRILDRFMWLITRTRGGLQSQ